MTRRPGLTFVCAVLAMIFAGGPLVRGQVGGMPATGAQALLLSDIHLDVFHDPAKVRELANAPVEQWSGILESAVSASQAKDFADLQKTCGVRGVDTSDALWRSSLAGMREHAAGANFAVVSGDLLAHGFDCKFKQVFPAAGPQEYVAFVSKTIRYIAGDLRASFPGMPIYIAMGNNDSGCGDYRDDANSPFLREMAKILVETLPAADRMAAARSISVRGAYAASLPKAVPGTRILVLDSLFLSAKYASCAGTPGRGLAAGQMAWLKGQISEARARRQKIWVVGHIPPGVDLYATARQMQNVCGRAKPKMFLGDETMAQVLAANSDIVRLAVFAHSHTDELRLLSAESSHASRTAVSGGRGVPVKIIGSISPVNGNGPSFTVAQVDGATANLQDYTVFAASNLTGIDAHWNREYTFSETYGMPSFTASTLAKLTAAFRADRNASTPESRAYLRFLFVGDRSALLKPLWPEYVCALTHDRAASFAQCVCAK